MAMTTTTRLNGHHIFTLCLSLLVSYTLIRTCPFFNQLIPFPALFPSLMLPRLRKHLSEHDIDDHFVPQPNNTQICVTHFIMDGKVQTRRPYSTAPKHKAYHRFLQGIYVDFHICLSCNLYIDFSGALCGVSICLQPDTIMFQLINDIIHAIGVHSRWPYTERYKNIHRRPNGLRNKVNPRVIHYTITTICECYWQQPLTGA